MDEMKIKSAFTKRLISRFVQSMLRKKLGHDIAIQFNRIDALVLNGKVYIRVDVDAEIEKDEILKITKNIV